jgi:signal transduction histidine kinase
MEFEQTAFVTLANAFSEMSLFIDPSLMVLRAYGPVFKYTGREPEEIEGQELPLLFSPESSKQLATLMNPMRARVQKSAADDSVSIEDEGMYLRNLSLLTSTGTILVELRIVPRRDSGVGGGTYYYMAVLNDLSYTKDLDKKKNSFFATMNHELRTPLNGIIGLTESLRSGEKEKARKKHFDMMLNSAQCMLKLVNNILDTAAMRNAAADLDLSQVKVNNLVEEVVELMNIAVDKRGRKLKKDTVEISVELEDDLPAIDMDKTKMFEAVEAIVNNALKFTHRGNVVIRTSEDPESHGAMIMVEDTGIGISKDSIERIFDAFEQEDDDHENRKFEGLGLGLTLAKEVVALHGGKLWVESEVGSGSKFFITIPPNVRALKLISEKQRMNPNGAISGIGGTTTAGASGVTQEEKDRMELIRVKQAEQIDLMQREVLAAMKAISHLTVDLELFEEKFKAYNSDPRCLGIKRSAYAGTSGSQLSVASHFLTNKVRSYEIPTANGTTTSPQSRLHRNFGVGTNFAYNNFY